MRRRDQRWAFSLARQACRADDKRPGCTAFANCTKNRTFSISWACRDQYRVMNSCMLSHATQAEQDASREEWFALRMERVRDRERKARRKAEQERFHREWWGLPDKDPELKKRAEDKLKLTERVGGFAAKDRPPAGGAPQEQKGL